MPQVLLVHDPVLVNEIRERLLRESNGVFLWVRLQIEALIRYCQDDEEVREALNKLPRDVAETYNQCLNKINITVRRLALAQKILRWVCCAVRPLLAEELKDVVEFGENRRYEMRSLMDTCGILLNWDPVDRRVRLAHLSTKQYLIQDRNDSTFHPAIRFVEDDGELECGQVCIIYLRSFYQEIERRGILRIPLGGYDFLSHITAARFILRLFPISRRRRDVMINILSLIHARLPDLKSHPFVEYAVENWAFQTRSISQQSPVWDTFRDFALYQDMAWGFFPWRADVASRKSYLHGLLGWTIRTRHVPLLRCMLESVLHPPICEFCDDPLMEYGLPALHLASRLGYEEVVTLLIKTCKVNNLDRNGWLPLHHTAEKGHFAAARLLIANGSKIDTVSKNRQTPLLLAAACGQEQSLQAWLDTEGPVKPAPQPLSDTNKMENVSIVQELLRHGANMEAKDIYGLTALYRATLFANPTMVEILLRAQAESDIRDQMGRTPLHLAARDGYQSVVEKLVEGKADIEAADNLSRTPLSFAAKFGQSSVVRHLLLHGANVNTVDKLQRSPLRKATEKGHERVVQHLLDYGAIPSQDSMYWAAFAGHENLYRLLNAHRVDDNVDKAQNSDMRSTNLRLHLATNWVAFVLDSTHAYIDTTQTRFQGCSTEKIVANDRFIRLSRKSNSKAKLELNICVLYSRNRIDFTIGHAATELEDNTSHVLQVNLGGREVGRISRFGTGSEEYRSASFFNVPVSLN